jgi:RING-type zinc-finger
MASSSRNNEPVVPMEQLHRSMVPRGGDDKDARFSCSICTDAVVEPVVTHCGHLYCWPCLYRWLEPGMTPAERNGLMGLTSVVLTTPVYDASKRVCPVCRASCSVKRIIPIYVRSTEATPTAAASARYAASSSEPPPQRFRSGRSDTTEEDDIAIDDMNDDRIGVVEDASSDEQELIRMDTSYSRTGLRLRIPSSARGEHDAATEGGMAVPRRPVARSSSHLQLAERDDVASAVSAAASRTTTHPASLSHGMLPFVQQALRHAAAAGGAEFVPPLHRLEGIQHSSPDWAAPVANRESTEFLSWLLLLLGSFVLFCLLLF